jgi:hypothetical protein
MIEEHAEVLRKAVTQPAQLQDIDWADSTLEVVETKEQAPGGRARILEARGDMSPRTSTSVLNLWTGASAAVHQAWW